MNLRAVLSVPLTIAPVACAATPEARLKQAYKRASETPFEEQPALYATFEREGTITPATRKVWTDAWAVRSRKRNEQIAAYQREQQRLAEERRLLWASLTPAQRFDLEMRERELQQQQRAMLFQAQQQQAAMSFQARQQRDADNQAAFQSFSDARQRQREMDAYNERTNALRQPVNVNVNGTINHNVNGRINVYNY